MVQKNAIVNSNTLDRSLYMPVDSNGNEIGFSKAITAATAFSIKADLNGVRELEFFINEEANANNIGGFNLSVKFYEHNSKEITGSSQTVAVPATTKNTNQFVVIPVVTYIEKADYCIITGTLPYTAAFTTSFYLKGFYETGMDDISSSMTTLHNDLLNVNSALATANANIKDVSSAVATMNANLSTVIYVDGAAFTYSASKTLATGGAVNPTRTGSDGDILPFAVDDTGQIRGAAFDPTAKVDRFANIFPVWEHFGFETLASVTNGADGTYNYYVDLEGYNRFGLGILAGASTGSFTLDISGTIQNDGTAPASIVEWQSISTDFLGGTKTYTTTAIDTFGNGEGVVDHFKYLKITIVSTASATADWILRDKVWSE